MSVPLTPTRILDPKSDVVFKKIFGQNPDLTVSFLNGVLPLAPDQIIEEITYLPPEQTPRIPALKNTIVDVKCRDNRGRLFIVEMQLHWMPSFQKRLLLGTAKAYVQQLEAGSDYGQLCPVYGLGIINDIYDPETPDWFHHYRLTHVQYPDKSLEGMELVLIELPKFTPTTFAHKRMGVLWLRFLREMKDHVQAVPEEFMQDPFLSKAVQLTQESSYSPGELDAYDNYWDAVSVYKTGVNDSYRLGIAKGKKEGIAKGIAKGKKEGIEEGIAKGKKEGIEEGIAKGIEQEKRAMALRLLGLGMSIEAVAQAAHVSMDQIRAWQAGDGSDPLNPTRETS